MSEVKLGIAQFQSWNCNVVLNRYKDGSPAISLFDGNGFPVARATVNVPEASLAPDELVIKDYAENAGMLDALIEASIVTPAGRTVPVGRFEVGHVCRLAESAITA